MYFLSIYILDLTLDNPWSQISCGFLLSICLFTFFYLIVYMHIYSIILIFIFLAAAKCCYLKLTNKKKCQINSKNQTQKMVISLICFTKSLTPFLFFFFFCLFWLGIFSCLSFLRSFFYVTKNHILVKFLFLDHIFLFINVPQLKILFS